MTSQPLRVVLVGFDEGELRSLATDETISLERAGSIGAAPADADVVVVALATGPLEAVRAARRNAPQAAIIVVTSPGQEADGAIAVHAGAEDHLVRDELFPALLPRAIRYAAAVRTIRRELSTIDEVTDLPNLRGFGAIAEHHLRMADRAGAPVVFVFVRLDEHEELRATEGAARADELARDAASIVLDAVRDADVPARIAADTIAVLLTGDAEGAETIVLSRLVEAIALHDARREQSRSLALSVGTARYEPGSHADLASILGGAARGLSRKTPS
jgi:diguanylate cyclase (GGDEF)-like protein